MCDQTKDEKRMLANAAFMAASDDQLVSAMAFVLNDNADLFLDAFAYALQADAEKARWRAGQRTHVSDRGAPRV